MESITTIIKSFLTFLLQLLELFVTFMIAGLNLVLSFAREVFGLVI